MPGSSVLLLAHHPKVKSILKESENTIIKFMEQFLMCNIISHVHFSSFLQPCKVGHTVIPILQMRN